MLQNLILKRPVVILILLLYTQKATIGLEKRRRRLKYFRAWPAQLLKQSFFEYVRGFSRVQSAILRAAVRYVVVRGSTMVNLVENHPNIFSSFLTLFCLSWSFSRFTRLNGISSYFAFWRSILTNQHFHLKNIPYSRKQKHVLLFRKHCFLLFKVLITDMLHIFLGTKLFCLLR